MSGRKREQMIKSDDLWGMGLLERWTHNIFTCSFGSFCITFLKECMHLFYDLITFLRIYYSNTWKFIIFKLFNHKTQMDMGQSQGSCLQAFIPREWVKVTGLHPNFGDSIVHGILQARILELVAFPFSRESWDLPNPGTEPVSPALQAHSLPAEPQEKPQNTEVGSLSLLQRIFLTQELNRGLLHCRRILYQLSYQSPALQVDFLPAELSGKPNLSLRAITYYLLQNILSPKWRGETHSLAHNAKSKDTQILNQAAFLGTILRSNFNRASSNLAREGIYLIMVNNSTNHEKGKLKNNFKRQETLRKGWGREEGVKRDSTYPL